MKTYIFMIISKSVMLRVRYVSDNVIDKINTHISRSRTFFFSKNGAFYEIMWKNMVQPDRSHTQIMCSSCIFHAGFQKLKTHTQNMYYLLLSYSNNGAPHCYVYSTMPACFHFFLYTS